MPCIFCRSEEHLTEEHVFAAFMGGELTVKSGSCDSCNAILGRAEAAIKEATIPLLNLLKIENRDGKVPNAPLNVEIRNIDMNDLPGFMDGSGNIQLRDHVREVVDDDGKKVKKGFFVTQEASETFAARESKRGGKLIERAVPKEIIVEADYTQSIIFAFTLETRKVAAKIALAAIALKYGVPFALSSDFDNLRAIRDETDMHNLPVRIFANENIMSAWIHTPYQHSVLCYLSAGMKKGWALVTLFGGLSYLVEVAGNYTEAASRQTERRLTHSGIRLSRDSALIRGQRSSASKTNCTKPCCAGENTRELNGFKIVHRIVQEVALKRRNATSNHRCVGIGTY